MPERTPIPDLATLDRQVHDCTRCALSATRTKAVPGEGSPTAAIVFIGEGPGYHEDQQGRPFVGPAGQLLDKLLASIGLKRADVYITNMVKCRPPNNRAVGDGKPGPISQQILAAWSEKVGLDIVDQALRFAKR